MGGLVGGKGGGGDSPPQVDVAGLLEKQAELNRINKITPFGSVFFGRFGETGGTPSAPTPVRPQTGLQALGQQVAPPAIPNQFGPGMVLGPGGVPIPANLAPQQAPAPTPAADPFMPTSIPGQPENFQTTSDISQVIELAPEVQRTIDAQLLASGLLGEEAAQRVSGLPSGALEFDNPRDAVERAIFERGRGLLDPVFERQEERLRDRLANQGLAQTGEAFANEFDIFNRNRGQTFENLARDAVIGGGAEESRALANALQRRALPFNELAALLSGAQINVPLPDQSTPLIDVTGPASLQLSQQNAAAAQAGADQRGLLGGLFDLGAAALPLIL